MRGWACLFLVAACGGAPPEEAPQGIVSLLPAWTEVIVELGEAERLVGCTDVCAPGRAVPRVPWRGPQAAEAIVRLRPALVVRQAPRAAQDPLRSALASAGIKVLSLPSETVADVRDSIVAIALELGKGGIGAGYVRLFDGALARARARAEGKPRPGVLFVFGRAAGAVAKIDAAGPGCFLDELLRYAGGRNVLEGTGPYPKVSLEEVVRLKPEVIIDNVPGGTDPYEAWRGFETIPAVRDRRVYAVSDNRLLIPGPHIPRSVERLVEMIHGRP
ncbi:MAG: ABC transporter substrate-binding protein [Planctomycetota bacterium]